MVERERSARLEAEERLKDANTELETLRKRMAALEVEVKSSRSSARETLASATSGLATGTQDLDAEIAKRLERLKTLVGDLSRVSTTSTTPPLASPGGSSNLPVVKATRADQIRESEGLLGRKDKPGKFNMLKYTSIGTAYGEEVKRGLFVFALLCIG
jgi:hypothetical protein